MAFASLAIVTWLAASGAGSDSPGDALARANYWNMLDAWVTDGGPMSEVQSRVFDTCTKLVLATVNYSEWAALLTERQGELDFRVDVCAKATIHRVHPQPEFLNSMFVDMICRDSKIALYRELCIKANLQRGASAT